MKFLTYNIQAAIGTKHYLDYGIKAHKQLVHTREKWYGLLQIARLIRQYDVVCLQEVDLGGLRSDFNNQAAQLQSLSKHPYMISQTNRTVGYLSIHGNAILSRYPLKLIDDIQLPGKIAGRGVLIAQACIDDRTYTIVNTHLSLGVQDQIMQFNLLYEKLRFCNHVILSGDFNCRLTSAHFEEFIHNSGLQAATDDQLLSFPSWKPKKSLDHILTSSDLKVTDCHTLTQQFSDHLAIAADVRGLEDG